MRESSSASILLETVRIICHPMQLSKTVVEPELHFKSSETLVGPGRVELPTPALSERCSNQLSYEPSKLGKFPRHQ
jgi:hypothetical protein